MKMFPEHNWNEVTSQDWKALKSQRHLTALVQEIFPAEQIQLNFSPPELIRSNGRRARLDIYLPYWKLAFEYQVSEIWNVLIDTNLREFNILKITPCLEVLKF